jgi:hypothetical protein
MNMVTVMTFNDPADAEVLRKRLEDAGIPTHILDERRQQRYRFMAEEIAGIHVQVDRGFFELARPLTEQWEIGAAAAKKAVHCPQCGSSRIEFPQVTRKFLMPWAYALLCAVGVCEKKFYCEDCHYTWPLHPKTAAPTDILGWPIRSKVPSRVESQNQPRL